MVVQGRRLLWQAIIGAGLADITLAWDEAVLGGLLLTPSFQEAMHVGLPARCHTFPCSSDILPATFGYYDIHDQLSFHSWGLAWELPGHLCVWHFLGQTYMAPDWQRRWDHWYPHCSY